MSLEMAHKVIVPPKKNYIPQFLKQRDINSYYGSPTCVCAEPIINSCAQVCTKLRKVVERWDGWLVSFLNGEEGQELRDIASGLLTVPLKVPTRGPGSEILLISRSFLNSGTLIVIIQFILSFIHS
jgi:hypothetical protein